MSFVDISPWAVGAAFACFGLLVVKGVTVGRNSWIFPAALSVAFFAFSLVTIASLGPLGFWTEHTRNLWGNQIWFDLLLAVGIGWCLIAPQARSLGMRLPLWFVAILCTGCIGFLAMLARLQYLRERASGETAVAQSVADVANGPQIDVSST